MSRTEASHCIIAAQAPVRERSLMGKISAEMIHGRPLPPNDQLGEGQRHDDAVGNASIRRIKEQE
jgi:hypothetical protein